MENENVITYEQVEERLRNVPLADYTAQDVQDRYIAYGSEEELNQPEIQALLIKHNYVDILTSGIVDFIDNKEVIKDIFASNLFEDKNIKFIQGRNRKYKLL